MYREHAHKAWCKSTLQQVSSIACCCRPALPHWAPQTATGPPRCLCSSACNRPAPQKHRLTINTMLGKHLLCCLQMSLGHSAPLHVALLQPLHSSHMEWPRTPHAGTPLSLPVPMALLSEKATCVWTRTGTAVAAPRVSAGGAGAPVERIGGRQVEAQLRQHLRKTP